MVCHHRSCVRNGSEAVYDAFKHEKSSGNSSFFVSRSECTGQCSSGPTVRVMPDQTWYCHVKPEDVPQIVTQHLQHNTPVESLLHPRFHPQFLPSVSPSSESQTPVVQASEAPSEEPPAIEQSDSSVEALSPDASDQYSSESTFPDSFDPDSFDENDKSSDKE